MENHDVRMFDNEDGRFLVFGPDKLEGTLETALDDVLPCRLGQSQIMTLLGEIGNFPPCTAYSLQRDIRRMPLALIELSLCCTITGDPIIFNARPGRALNEWVVEGRGPLAAVVPKIGAYTTYGEVARVSPLELYLTRDQLPEKLRRKVAPAGVSQHLWNELVDLADADSIVKLNKKAAS